MDKYRHLGTLLLRCITHNLNYRILTNEDNNFYLIFDDKSLIRIVEFSSDQEIGKFSIRSRLSKLGILSGDATVDYFIICTNQQIKSDLSYSNFILKSVCRVNSEEDYCNLYLSEGSDLDFDRELESFCDRTKVDFRGVLDSLCAYLNGSSQLTQDEVNGTLLYLLLCPYKLEPNFEGGSGYNSIWSDITSDKLLTVVDCSCVEFLLDQFGAVSQAKMKYKDLWLSNQVSLLLNVDNSDDFLYIVSVLTKFSLKLRVILLTKCDVPLQTKRCFASAADLTESQFWTLCDIDVDVQGRFTVKLGEILNEVPRTSFKCADIIRVVSAPRQVFEAKSLVQYYIGRRVFKVILRLSVLEEVDRDFFVVRNKVGSGNMLLKRLISKELGNVRIVEDGDEFHESDDVPVHFVNFWGENWVEWKETRGDTENLRGYILPTANCDCDLSELVLEERRTIVISGGAGMGKSLFLEALGLSLADYCWVETIDLSQSTALVNSGNIIFRHFLNQKRVHALVDGFDQAPIDESLKFLEHLQKLGVKLWVVARPNNAPIIEKRLKTISMRLAPFTTQNQLDFLMGYYNANKDSREFVQELLKVFQSTFSNLIEKPLFLKILADLFVHDYKRFLLFGVFDLEAQFWETDVLDAFLQGHLELLYTKYPAFSNDLRKFLDDCSLLALTVKFDENDLINLRLREKAPPSEVLRILSSEEVLEGEQFKYDQLNDYLAAKWIASNLTNRNDAIKDTVIILLQRRFSDLRRYAKVFTMLDYILARDCPHHVALIKGKVTEVIMQEAQSELFYKVDKGGRTIAHIAALYGVYHPKITNNIYINTNDAMATIIELSDQELITTEDKLLRYNPLDYALGAGTLSVANTICAKLPSLPSTFSISLSDLETYFDYCTKVDSYKHLYKNLLKHALTLLLLQNKINQSFRVENFLSALNFDELLQDNVATYIQTFDVGLVRHFLEALEMKTPMYHNYTNLNLACAFGCKGNIISLLMDGAYINSLQFYTPLHCAVIHKRLDVIDLLLSLGAKINAKDRNGNTPLHLACQMYCNNPIVEKLLQNNASTNLTNQNGDTPLHCALKSSTPDTARLFFPKYRYQQLLSLNPGSWETTDLNTQNLEGETPLLLAIKHRHTSVINELLENHVDVNITNKNKDSCLHYAAKNQDTTILKNLMYNYIYINGRNENGETPLLVALKSGRISIAQELIAKGADVNVSDNDFMSCLHYAVKWGQDRIVKRLLDRDANINKTINTGATPLMHAIMNDRSETAYLLIRRGADVNLSDESGSTALHYAATTNHHQVAQALISHGAKLDPYNNSGETPLISALKAENYINAESLLDLGADFNARDRRGSACLHLAASVNTPLIIHRLLQKNPEIDILDSDGNTPLLIALNQEVVNSTVVYQILNKNPNVFVKNKFGFSAIHYAAKECLNDLLAKLIRKGMDVNDKSQSGLTPLLMHVAESCTRSTVKLLTDNGADISVVDPGTGNSCLHHLVNSYDDDIISDLVKLGADVNVKNNAGDTPLHYCIKSAQSNKVPLLLSLGADPNMPDNLGCTSLHLSVARREDDAVEALLDNGANVNLPNNDGETPLARARRLRFAYLVEMMTDKDGSYKKFRDLCDAVKRGNVFQVKTILTDAFVDRKNEDGNTLLMLALINLEFGIADYLISRGASLYLTNNRGDTTLHQAAKAGDLVIVRRHLDSGVDINVMNTSGDTPLITALYAQNRHVAELLLERGASLDLTPLTNPKQTCVHLAIEAGFNDIVVEILDRGFMVDALNSRGATSLMKALSYKNTHIAKILIDRGANVNAQDESRATPLHLAASECLPDMVQLLLDRGAEVNAVDSIMEHPLMNAIDCSNDPIAELLLSKGSDVYLKNSWDCYTLQSAASSGMDSAIVKILDLGFDVNTEIGSGNNALLIALVNRNIGTVQLLIEKGAQIDVCNDNNTCLHLAVEVGFEDLVRELLERKYFCITDRNPANFTPLTQALQYEFVSITKLLFENALSSEELNDDYGFLHLAAEFGDLSIVTALLEKGDFDLNHVRSNGAPIVIAAKHQNWLIVDLLVERGADVNVIDVYGRTCLHYLSSSTCDTLLLKVIKKGANVNAREVDGTTPLVQAIDDDKHLTVKLLLSHGADPNIVDSEGRTALHHASTQSEKILKCILEKIDDIDKQTNENETALSMALQNGHNDLALMILDFGASNLNYDNGNTCLHYAAENGLLDILVWIADKFGNINDANADGYTPLMLALKYDQEDIVKVLLDRSADTNISIHHALSSCLSLFIDKCDLNEKNQSGKTPLHAALEDCYKDSVRQLLEHGADAFGEDPNGNTCLHFAAKHDDTELVKLFLDKGLDLNKKNKSGETCLEIAVDKGNFEVMKVLLESGGDHHVVSKSGKTCLLTAVENCDQVLVAKLLEQNVDVNVQCDNELTPLLAALDKGESALAKMLIEAKADVWIRWGEGTCLHTAISQGADVVKELLDAGLDINFQDKNGDSPLLTALKSNHLNAIPLLLSKGANPHLQNNDGYSCLHYAAGDHDQDTVLLFLQKYVSFHLRTSRGNTPLLYALQRQQLDNAKLLLRHGAPFDVKNYKGNSCLYYAAKAGFDDLVEEFIDKGEPVDTLNVNCFTPFLAALFYSRLDTAKLLVRKGADVNIRGHTNQTWMDYTVDVEFLRMILEKGFNVNYGKHSYLLTALKNRQKDVADFLIAHGADVHLIDINSGESCLHLAVKADFDDIVTHLIKEGLDVNRLNSSKETPLRLSFKNKSVSIIKLLLAAGALTLPENFSDSYLDYAAEIGDDDITLELIKRGLDLNSRNACIDRSQ